MVYKLWDVQTRVKIRGIYYAGAEEMENWNILQRHKTEKVKHTDYKIWGSQKVSSILDGTKNRHPGNIA